MSHEYSEADLKADISKLIDVFAAGDGGPSLVYFMRNMESVRREMHEQQTGASESLMKVFRQFVKLTDALSKPNITFKNR